MKSNEHEGAATTARTETPTPMPALQTQPSPAKYHAPMQRIHQQSSPRSQPKTPAYPLAYQVPNRTPPSTWPTPSGAFEDTYDMQNIHHIHEKRKTNRQTQTMPKRQGRRKSVGGNGKQSREGRKKTLGFPGERGNARGNARMPEGTRELSRERWEHGNAMVNLG